MNGLISSEIHRENDHVEVTGDRRTIRVRQAILQALDDLGASAGAKKIGDILHENGIELQARSIRFHLQKMDQVGLTRSTANNTGRLITETGSRELARIGVMSKVGFISSRMDELGYRMTFDPETGIGNLIANIAFIRKSDLSRSIHHLKPVFSVRLSMGDRIAVRMPGSKFGIRHAPRDKIIISTICSVSINGILQKAGIPVISRFGGLIEMVDGKPKRFVELMEYRGTSVDPHKIFIMAGMTQVNRFAATGNGVIGVSFREFPSAANDKVKGLISTLAKLNLNGVLAIGHPNRQLLDVRVGEGRTGMITIDGLNPVAALHEAGIPVELYPLDGLEEAAEYVPFAEVAPMERRGAYVE